MGYMGTFYVEVQANQISTFSVNIPSGADTTSGYYISYQVALGNDGGGFTGTGWYLDDPKSPLAGMFTSDEEIIKYYNEHQNLDTYFAGWMGRVGEVGVSDFCNSLMHNDAYVNGCISMVK